MSTKFKIAHKLNKKWRSADVALDDNLFENLMLKEEILKGLAKCGFVKPSPIQLEAIPLGRCGLDLVIQSKSGTGKTCVYAITALETLLESNCPQVLILCPTREIAFQVQEVITSIGCFIKNLSCKLVTGGSKLEKDNKSLKNCKIVVGTPGRVNHVIELGILKTDSIRMLILDEADKLLNVQLKDQIDLIFQKLCESKQTIAVSATFPIELAQLIQKYMQNPCFVRLNEKSPSLIGITQYYHKFSSQNLEASKLDLLLKILSKVSFSQCLIFRNSYESVELLFKKLKEEKWPCAFISRHLSQAERWRSLKSLKATHCRIMVSTDIFARGIDCENVNLVINMDMPNDFETYFHRIGRAGRFGSRGIAITFLRKEEDWDSFEKMKNDFEIKTEALPNLDQIFNLWNMFDPSLDEKVNLDSNEFLKKLKEQEKKNENTSLNLKSLFDDWINFKNNFKYNENDYQIKIKLETSPSFHLIQTQSKFV